MITGIVPVLLLSTASFANAQAGTAFLPGFQSTLSNLGFGRFSDALNSLPGGSASPIVTALSSGQPYTIYVPVNEAWNIGDNVDLEKLVSYHISSAAINNTDVAPPRQHTIAYIQLYKDQSLPGKQPQVIVLETAPAGNSNVLIRGADWNATSKGKGSKYQDINIQPIDRILSPPPNLLDLLALPLHSTAINGTPAALKAISDVGLKDSLVGCRGCTFFIPNDAAIAAVNFTSLTSGQIANVLLGHVINGDVKYSTEMNAGDTWTSAAGVTVAYGMNATGAFVTCGGAIARILRSDIIASNGVVHLVNRVFGGPQGNVDRAASALSAASAQAATQTVADGVLGRIPTSIPATLTSTQTARSSSSSSAARRRSFIPILGLTSLHTK